MDMTSFLIGAILGCMGIVVFGVGIFILFLLTRLEYKYYVRIRNFTGGKAVCEYFWAKKIRHPDLGEVYYIPKLIKEKRQYLRFVDSRYELPYKNKKYTLHYTWYNGEYTPEDFEDVIIEEREVLNPVTMLKETKKIERFIIRPVSKLMRQFVIHSDAVIEKETEVQMTWWDKNKWIVFGLIMGIIFAGVCITMIIYAFQFSNELLQAGNTAPPWLQSVLNASTNGMAPPS